MKKTPKVGARVKVDNPNSTTIYTVSKVVDRFTVDLTYRVGDKIYKGGRTDISCIKYVRRRKTVTGRLTSKKPNLRELKK